MALVKAVYKATANYPASELYGLVSQMRRAAVSIPCNIAEGQGRVSPGEFAQFLGNARGSLLELQTLIDISTSLEFIHPEELKNLMSLSEEVLRILNGLMASVKAMKAGGKMKSSWRVRQFQVSSFENNSNIFESSGF